MSTIIRADTDQLRAVARQMRSVSAEILTGSRAADQAMQALDAVWSGSARDRGMARWAEIAPRYQPDAERLIHLANELEALAQRLDDAAAVFGDIPRNMYDMYRKIGEKIEIKIEGEIKSKYYAIKIFQVSENEYAITIGGTEKSGILGGNSWSSAILSGFGFDTPYANKVREALRTLPPGAQVHLFGYSQGGIVANNIAQEKDDFACNGIHIKSVNTFGAPLALKYVSGVEYNEFDAPGDLVSVLNPIAQGADGSIIIQNLESYGSLQLANLDRVHASYDDANSPIAKEMCKARLPFEVSKWKLCKAIDVSEETWTSEEIGKAATNLARDITRETGDFVGGVARETGEYIGDVRDAVQQRVLEPMRRIPGLF
jgi:uncharacterized protein YukE